MKRKINLKKLDSRFVKAKFIGYNDKSTAYILQEFKSMKVIKAHKESEIQPFSAKDIINPEQPNLMTPNMDFDDDRLKDEKTNELIQDEVGKNNVAIPAVQHQQDDEKSRGNPKSRSLQFSRTPAHLKKRFMLSEEA